MAEVIAILDEDGNQLFSSAVNIGVSVAPSKVFARHSIENKQVVIDDQFDNPTSLSMRMILNPSDYVDVYKEIKTAYDSITNFTIQTKVDLYQNMYLESLPHEEDPSMFNTISMTLEFTEQLIVASDSEVLTTANTSNSSDTDTVDSGQKSNTDDDGTVAQRLFRRVFG
ncbi:hypothetical protein KKJFFJLC_00061 [Vibrio phage vB_VpaS_PGB]|nr:hypothetical protein HHKILHMN_00036 [Vibrio phage vB_VpaS_PGA]WVH05604.1 hypothetical protein KKJFFJLC_00061 [Vibrio phage vB_VpaS_PGB]